jgi:hypothetical protein
MYREETGVNRELRNMNNCVPEDLSTRLLTIKISAAIDYVIVP